jgi:demethylmenaquinone methyltransferase/2-methoxy-6-polyprenyl-1,4-benzoquinol methylase
MNNAIQKMFDTLPRRYELINHVITFGLDTAWRKRAVKVAADRGAADAGTGRRRVWLDVSTGTGEMAELLSRATGPDTAVAACDFSLPMLREAARKSSTDGILLLAADDCRLPLRDASLDLVTISLGTRNLNTSRSALVSCFREFNRVLRPGGRFVNLETSQPRSRLVRALFHAYVRGFLRPVASHLSGNRRAHSYLAGTVCSFYEAEGLSDIIREAGFARVDVTRLFVGVAAIHSAEKR